MREENDTSKTIPKILTTREQEVFDLLLKGDTPKKIGSKLKISYYTVLGHQKNLYHKLSVNSINELLIKYSKPLAGDRDVFIDWWTHNNHKISITPGRENIENQYIQTFMISGIYFVSPDHDTYCRAVFNPHPSILEVIKKMTSFSFTFLSDGNTYNVSFVSMQEDDMNQYRKKTFMTKKGEISKLTINVKELCHELVPFYQDNIDFIQFEVQRTKEFNLKVWDFRFNL